MIILDLTLDNSDLSVIHDDILVGSDIESGKSIIV